MAPLLQTDRAEEFVRLLRKRLRGKTVNHSISAARFMASYATKAGITPDQAVTTGLLHDLCKDMAGDALIAAAEGYGIEVSAIQRLKPKLLHGPVAAEECRRSHLVDDEAVYEAIYWHTTGRPGFGKVGLALYLADFAEPLRKIPEAAEARSMLDAEGFHKALLFASKAKLDHLHTKGVHDPTTGRFQAWLERELG